MTGRRQFTRSGRPLRIEASAALAAVGGVMLLVSLFLDWYQPDLSAWTTFEVLDLVLAGIALASLAAAAAEVGLVDAVPARSLPVLGGAAVVIVAAALINHPPLALGHPPRAGIWLAFGSSLLILLGGLLRVARVSLAISFDTGDDVRAAPRARPTAPPDAHTEPLPPE